MRKRCSCSNGLCFSSSGVADIGAVEAGGIAARLFQAQDPDDVLAGLRIGGGGERHQRHRGKVPAQLPELHVFGAEIVAPLRHAVRLVDSEQGDIDVRQPFQERRGHEALRRDIEQFQLVSVQPRQHLACRGAAQCRIVERRLHPVGLQCIHLVFHQRDQRRHHDSDSRPVQGRQLVAQRLAAAGGHQHEGIAAADEVLDDVPLVGAETVETEHPAQGGVDVVRDRGGAAHGWIVRRRGVPGQLLPAWSQLPMRQASQG